MKTSELPFPGRIKDVLPKIELNEPQRLAVEAGLLDGKNMVVASPTASGKTFIAELAFLGNFLRNGKAVYVCPLKALASEKYHEFQERYKSLGIKIAISIGDFDSAEEWLGRYDLIIATSEKLDSIMRHNAPWLSKISLLIVDEIHLLNDAGRGPTLEVVMTRIMKDVKPQILALSATIKNSDEIAEWLDAELVRSNYRPVKLRKGVFYPREKVNMLEMEGDVKEMKEGEAEKVLSHDTLQKKKQALVFVSTRRSAESVAEKLAKNLSIKDPSLLKLSKEIEKVLHVPTKQCRRLAMCVAGGTAFHHAGLVAKQRKLVEDAFRQGQIKILSATPTLCLDKNVDIWDSMNLKKPTDKINKVIALKNNNLIESSIKDVKVIDSPKVMRKIETICGNSITLTGNHKVLVYENEKSKLKTADCIKKGEKIAMAGKINISKVFKPSWKDFVLDNEIPFKNKKLDAIDFYFIGAMLGDGYSGAQIKNGKIFYKGNPCLVGQDKEIFKFVEEFCKRYSINFRKRKNSCGVSQIFLSKSKWLREFLVRCGIDKGEKKFINTSLLGSNTILLRHLLSGLFDTDGCVEKRGVVSFSNISDRLIEDTRRALLRYGIITWKRKRHENIIKVGKKSYNTKESIEIRIQHNFSLFKFFDEIGFKVNRKHFLLNKIIKKRKSISSYFECKKCKYKVQPGSLSGRTKKQIEWAVQKKKIIKLLALNGQTTSNDISRKLGFVPWKNEKRLNLHYPFIEKERLGNTKMWKLTKLGIWCYNEIISKNISLENYFDKNPNCPLCNLKIIRTSRGNWKKNSFQGDIFWDIVKVVKKVAPTCNSVYDIVMADNNRTDHMFVANGFIVHNSWGINMPAYRVVIRDVKRYGYYGTDYIPVLEVEQMAGRAGRPAYDKEGEAILVGKDASDANELKERYIMGEPEPIYSKLSVEPMLRMHTLSLLASEAVHSRGELEDFFSRTFFSHQYGNISEVMGKVDAILRQLEGFNFIETEESGIFSEFKPAFDLGGDFKIRATKLGKKVSELYLDPLSANTIITGMNAHEDEFMTSLNTCNEMFPPLSVLKKDDFVEEEMLKSGIKSPDVWDYEYNSFLSAYKTYMMFRDWMDERGEDALMEKYGVTPGELYTKTKNAEWMLYSSAELARLLRKFDKANEFRRLQLRIKHGIRDELLRLIMLKGIGRVRARSLFNSGIKTPADIKKTRPEVLAEIVGKKTAAKLLQEASQPLEKR